MAVQAALLTITVAVLVWQGSPQWWTPDLG
jgi:hypothetical protein